MNLESSKTIVDQKAQSVFDFLANPENYKKLMPENTSKFELVGDDGFIFALSGMPEIELKIKELLPPNKIVLGSKDGKLDFSLKASINEIEEQKSETQFLFEGDFNPMISMMIKGPIKKFIETLAENLPTKVQ